MIYYYNLFINYLMCCIKNNILLISRTWIAYFVNINYMCEQIGPSNKIHYRQYIFYITLSSHNLYRTLDRNTRFDAYRIHILRSINLIYTETRMFYPTRHTRLILLHYSVGLLCFQFMSLPERHIAHKECTLLHVRDTWWIVRRNEENMLDATQRQKLLRVPLKPK